jgi:hypothetical protein
MEELLPKSKNPKTAPPSTEVVPPGGRRAFGAAEKVRIVREADAPNISSPRPAWSGNSRHG